MSHSPEPWSYDKPNAQVKDARGRVVFACDHWETVMPDEEDWLRIVACVNFLAGIHTDDLRLLEVNPLYRENAIADIHSAVDSARRSRGVRRPVGGPDQDNI